MTYPQRAWFKIKLTSNGTYAFTGTLGGKQHRTRFKTESEAKAHAQRIEIQHWNETKDGKLTFTRLSEPEINDATAALALLKEAESTRNLTFAVNYLLKHHHEVANARSVGVAVRDYVDHKSKEQQRGGITSRQFRSIKMELSKLAEQFPSEMVSGIRSDNLESYLESPIGRSSASPSDKTWNNRRGYLNTFFAFCLTKKFIAENPVAEIPQRKNRTNRGTAETLTANEATKLMHWLETYRGKQNKNGSWWCEAGAMVPYFALALFAGIRPDWKDGELSKLKPEHIQLDTGVIRIEPEVSKVNESRQIKIQPNLRLWLEKYPPKKHPIIARRRFRDLREDIRKTWKLGHNVLRHTFISMTVGAFRSIGDAAIQAGDSEAIVRRHYLDLKTESEADRFWQIVPSSKKLTKATKQDGRYVLTKKPSRK